MIKNLRKNYSLLVFDWDGTLVNSEGLVVESIQQIATDFGYPVPTSEKLKKYFGISLQELHQLLFPQEDYVAFARAFHQYFTEEKLATYFFKGAIETLIYLYEQGFTLAIATNKPRAKLEKALSMASIKELFAATRCPEDGAAKPNPEMLLSLFEELGYHPNNALMIGDTVFDLQLAQGAQVDAIAACYSHHRKEELALYNPVGYIEDISDLKELKPYE